jgi:transposase
VERFEAGVKGDRAEVWIELLGKGSGPRRCSGCGRFVRGVHDWTQREIRDLPILDADTILHVWRCRVACPQCGPKLEALDWLEPYARVTKRLAASVAKLCKVMPIKQVAALYSLHWSTVKAIDKAHLEKELGPPDFTDVELLLIDAFALRKGHRYATVVADAATSPADGTPHGPTRRPGRTAGKAPNRGPPPRPPRTTPSGPPAASPSATAATGTAGPDRKA